MQLNRKGIKPDNLLAGAGANAPEKGNDLLLQNSGLKRFETKSNPRPSRGRRRPYNKKNEGNQK
jgi:hypothetical protein